MAKDSQQSGSGAEDMAASLTLQAEAHAAAAQELARLREALAASGEENLKLHRQTVATIQAMQQDIERMKRTLRSLVIAR